MTKVINLTDFTNQWEEGRVNFLILNAKFDEISTVRGESEVLKLDLELTKIGEKTAKMTLRNHLLFIDYTQKSLFHQFILAANDVLDSKSFTAENLIGLAGEAELKYYQREGSKFSFERMFDWRFKFLPKETEKVLKHHFDVNDSDIDF